MSGPGLEGFEGVIENDRKFLIVERNRLVGEDLADIVREYHPGAQVELVADLPEAETYAAHVTGVSLAFVGGAHSTDLIDPLAAKLATKGGQVVLMRDFGERDNVGRKGWLFLAQPFTTGSVFRLLADSSARRVEAGELRGQADG